MGFAGLHPPDATGAASEDKPRGSAKEAAASAVHQGGLRCPGEGAGALAQAGLLSTVGLGQLVIRICATSKHTARFYSWPRRVCAVAAVLAELGSHFPLR